MQVTIQSVDYVKTNEQGTSSRVKTSSGEYFYVQEDATPLIGRTVEADINEKTSQQGKKYKTGKIKQVITAAAVSDNGAGKITWDDYRAMAEAAHELASKLEPDESGMDDLENRAVVKLDRSTARAAILNTVMIAYSNGKIFVPKDDTDDIPF